MVLRTSLRSQIISTHKTLTLLSVRYMQFRKFHLLAARLHWYRSTSSADMKSVETFKNLWSRTSHGLFIYVISLAKASCDLKCTVRSYMSLGCEGVPPQPIIWPVGDSNSLPAPGAFFRLSNQVWTINLQKYGYICILSQSCQCGWKCSLRSVAQTGVENILKVEHKSKDVQEHFVYITYDCRFTMKRWLQPYISWFFLGPLGGEKMWFECR
jgi:hypothetical protein